MTSVIATLTMPRLRDGGFEGPGTQIVDAGKMYEGIKIYVIFLDSIGILIILFLIFAAVWRLSRSPKIMEDLVSDEEIGIENYKQPLGLQSYTLSQRPKVDVSTQYHEQDIKPTNSAHSHPHPHAHLKSSSGVAINTKRIKLKVKKRGGNIVAPSNLQLPPIRNNNQSQSQQYEEQKQKN